MRHAAGSSANERARSAGWANAVGSWPPERTGESTGPSRWRPSSLAPGGRSTSSPALRRTPSSVRAADMSCAMGAVDSVATTAPTPCRSSVAAMRSRAAGPPSASPPPAPWQWTSMKAGARTSSRDRTSAPALSRRRLRSVAAGGSTSTSEMRPSRTCTTTRPTRPPGSSALPTMRAGQGSGPITPAVYRAAGYPNRQAPTLFFQVPGRPPARAANTLLAAVEPAEPSLTRTPGSGTLPPCPT